MRSLLPRAVLLAALSVGVAAQPAVAMVPLDRPATTRTSAPDPCRTGRVALTFDDGPSPRQTARLVRVLDSLDVPATFFMVGRKVDARPGVARLVARHGFAIGNHTYAHDRLVLLPPRLTDRSLSRTARALDRAGVRATRLFRPPFGESSPGVRAALRRHGLVPVLWSADSRDWAGGGPRAIAGRTLAQLRPDRATVVLQHDGVPNSAASVDSVALVVRAARRRGFCFVGLDRSGRPAAYRPRTAATPSPAADVAPEPEPTTRPPATTTPSALASLAGPFAGR